MCCHRQKKTIIGFWLVQIDLTDSEQLSEFHFTHFQPKLVYILYYNSDGMSYSDYNNSELN